MEGRYRWAVEAGTHDAVEASVETAAEGLPRPALPGGASVARAASGPRAAAVADVEIRWPLGRKERLEKVGADQLIWVKEGSGITRSERFAPMKR